MPRKRREPEYGIEKTKRPKRRVKGRDVPEAGELEVLLNKPLANRVQKVVDAFTEIENLARHQADAIQDIKTRYAPMVAEQEETIRTQQPYIEEELAIPADEAANALYRIDQYTIQVIQLLQKKIEVIRTPSDAQKLELVLDRLEKTHSRTHKEIVKFIESVAVPTEEELPGARQMAVMPTLEQHKVGWSNRVKEADIGEWAGKGWDWIQEQVSNFTSAVGDFLNNIWPLEKDLQEAIVELEGIGSTTTASKVGSVVYSHQGWKFIVWEGYEGGWFWKVTDAPYHLDGTSVSKENAIIEAKDAIDRHF